MGFLDRLAKAYTAARSEEQLDKRSFNAPSRSKEIAKRPVNDSEALTLGSVYRAVNLIVTAVKQLPWKVVTDTGTTEANTFVKQPDPLVSKAAFLEMTTTALALNGNAFWRLGRNSRGEVVTAENLNPAYVDVLTDKQGRTTGFKYMGTKEYSTDEVKHLALFRVAGRARGLSPIEAANEELRGALDLSQFGANWFNSGGIPTGILKTEQHLTPEMAQEAKDAWNASASAGGGTAVIGNGLDWKQTAMSPAEAQAAELRKLSATEVARLFGVPASLMLADAGSSLTYSNLQQEWVAWVRFGITTYTLEIEQAMSSLLPRGKEIRFTYDALLRPDTEARYRAHAIALAGEPFMTVDEVRALEDLQG